jgi:hydroxymethylpyrimidine/phosphomethylpyrimidine kinase
MTPIASSDRSPGAGIQVDLKTFSAFGVYGATVITALTAQNAREVRLIEPVRAAFVSAQVDAVSADLWVDAVKIGMLGKRRSSRRLPRARSLPAKDRRAVAPAADPARDDPDPQPAGSGVLLGAPVAETDAGMRGQPERLLGLARAPL